jgi:hypothetical protein
LEASNLKQVYHPRINGGQLAEEKINKKQSYVIINRIDNALIISCIDGRKIESSYTIDEKTSYISDAVGKQQTNSTKIKLKIKLKIKSSILQPDAEHDALKEENVKLKTRLVQLKEKQALKKQNLELLAEIDQMEAEYIGK